MSLGDQLLLALLPLLVAQIGARLLGGLQSLQRLVRVSLGFAQLVFFVEIELLGTNGVRIAQNQHGLVALRVCFKSAFAVDDHIVVIVQLLVHGGFHHQQTRFELGIGEFGENVVDCGDPGLRVRCVLHRHQRIDFFLRFRLRLLRLGESRGGANDSEYDLRNILSPSHCSFAVLSRRPPAAGSLLFSW